MANKNLKQTTRNLNSKGSKSQRKEELSAAYAKGTARAFQNGELRDTATATLWLLSDEAQFVTGAILDVSGGFATP